MSMADYRSSASGSLSLGTNLNCVGHCRRGMLDSAYFVAAIKGVIALKNM